MKLSKSDYLAYVDCPHDAWLNLHKPELCFKDPSLFDQANMEASGEVHGLARELFAAGIVIGFGDTAGTKRHVERRAAVLHRPTFEGAKFTTVCDILVWRPRTKTYDLYEIDVSTNRNHAKTERYAGMLAFQSLVLRECGVQLGRTFVLHLNGEYVQGSAVDTTGLFVALDLTQAAAARSEAIAADMLAAHRQLMRTRQPEPPCCCMLRGRGSHCATFGHTNPAVPDYSIHDLARISSAKLAALVGLDILGISEIPDVVELTAIQRNQVKAARTNKASIDKAAITGFLGAMRYPLAFLDYETFPAAVPRFPGYRPYDQIPFQFSLHVVEEATGEPRHVEFLAD